MTHDEVKKILNLPELKGFNKFLFEYEEELRDYRIKNGLTQSKLAKKMKCNVGIVKAIEAGEWKELTLKK